MTSFNNGWNFMRWPASDGIRAVDSSWAAGNFYVVRVIVSTSAATSVTVGHFFCDCPAKAQILFIADRGYKNFYTDGYPDLKARGIPVTWALDPTLLGTNVGNEFEVIALSDLQAIVRETAIQNDISIHSWDGSVTSTMTAAQLRTDHIKAVKTIEGLIGAQPGMAWRAAFTQDAASNASAIQDLVLAYGTPTSSASLSCWPFPNRWNVPRFGIHNLPTTGSADNSMDTLFQVMQCSHQLFVVYIHGITDDYQYNVTTANWAYFVSKLDAALNSNWLEGVTFTELFKRSGGQFRQGFGSTVAEYYDETGALVAQPLP